MDWRFGMVIGTALLVAGCGDDSGVSSEQAELRGIFQAGNVSGVHYQTPTRDGLTDASGTFQYLPGETVTFSIGGIQLGAVPGAAAVTPFTLSGMTPPTTEPALRRELDRAIRTTSNFVRAVNMDRLLLALDADHDPANGIDVRGHESALANATIDFDQPLPQFAANLEKLAPNLTHNLPRWFPIVHLYHALGIAVPVHVPVQYDYDTMFFPRQLVISYYPDGSRKSEDSVNGYNGALYGTTYAYDSLGRTTARRTASLSTWQYDFTDEERWTYDARGTVTANVRERDEGADGTIEFSTSVAHEFDAFNNLLRQLTRQDNGADGSVDWLFDYRVTYDARMNPERVVWETDTDADGTAESRSSSVLEYDSGNRLRTRRTEGDAQADGIVDSIETSALTYGAGDRGELEVYELDDDADGNQDLRLTYRWSYDSRGSLRTLEILQEHDLDADGSMDSFSSQTVTYDRFARALSEVDSQRSSGGTDNETSSRRTYTYADHGGPLRVATEWDVGGDGEVDAHYVTEYEYGAGGELLSIRNPSEPVPVGGSTETGSTQVTNVLVADGVLALAQQYFEFWYSLGQVSTF